MRATLPLLAALLSSAAGAVETVPHVSLHTDVPADYPPSTLLRVFWSDGTTIEVELVPGSRIERAIELPGPAMDHMEVVWASGETTLVEQIGRSLAPRACGPPVPFPVTARWDIEAEGRPALAEIAACARDVSGPLALLGFADPRGGDLYNRQLGAARAATVAAAVRAEGVTTHLLPLPLGEQLPASVGTDPDALHMSRRVEARPLLPPVGLDGRWCAAWVDAAWPATDADSASLQEALTCYGEVGVQRVLVFATPPSSDVGRWQLQRGASPLFTLDRQSRLGEAWRESIRRASDWVNAAPSRGAGVPVLDPVALWAETEEASALSGVDRVGLIPDAPWSEITWTVTLPTPLPPAPRPPPPTPPRLTRWRWTLTTGLHAGTSFLTHAAARPGLLLVGDVRIAFPPGVVFGAFGEAEPFRSQEAPRAAYGGGLALGWQMPVGGIPPFTLWLGASFLSLRTPQAGMGSDVKHTPQAGMGFDVRVGTGVRGRLGVLVSGQVFAGLLRGDPWRMSIGISVRGLLIQKNEVSR